MPERMPSTGANQRVLITGTGGFIAPHVAALFLDRGYDVFGLDKRPASVLAPTQMQHHVCDLLDRDRTAAVLAMVQPTLVLHLAARTDLDETRDIAGYAANFEGVDSLCDAMARVGTVQRAICTSSQLVNPIGHVPTSPDEYDPRTLYGESKVLTERRWRAHDGAGTTWSIVRPTTIWGPGMDERYLSFFRMLRKGLYFHVGRSSQVKSYGYVSNTAAQLLALAEAERDHVHGKVFYLADYEPLLLQAWAESLRRELGAPPIHTLPLWAAVPLARVGDVLTAMGLSRFPLTSFRLKNILTSYLVDVEPVRALCPVLPCTMEEGVRQTVRWLDTESEPPVKQVTDA